MEITDHAGETNGPEPAEETGARDKGERRNHERKLRKRQRGREGEEEGTAVSHR